MWTKALLNTFAHEATERWAKACDGLTSMPPGKDAWPAACLAAERAHRRLYRWNFAWLGDERGLEEVDVRTYNAAQQARMACDDRALRRHARLWVERRLALHGAVSR